VWLQFFIFFLLDQKERKNQESPNVASRQSLSATRTFIFIRNQDFFVVMNRAFSAKTCLLIIPQRECSQQGLKGTREGGCALGTEPPKGPAPAVQTAAAQKTMRIIFSFSRD
jgi:hypothetical protein